jgi:DNA ligase 1
MRMPLSLQASARMRARQLPAPKPYYVTAEQPDMWFDAAEVWEIRGADLTISPVHKVGPGVQGSVTPAAEPRV